MRVLAIFQQLHWGEIMVLLFLALLIFGAKRLPEIGKSMGKGIREFKDATRNLADDVRSGIDDDKTPAADRASED